MIQLPDSFYERPEALIEVYVGSKLGADFGTGLRGGRQVFEEIEEEAVFVVEGYGRVDDALVEVAEGCFAFWRVCSTRCGMLIWKCANRLVG
jgi:hypothetical protein